jgi:choice-of-anchor A domain-containing protein
MAGASFTGSQTIVDNGGATNLAYWGLPGNTSITLGGNASFVGTIYAPEADFSLGGGGNSNFDFIGSVIARSISMNGHFSFHFDENLLRVGAARGYAATTWKEL